jgi:hypothetical protein
VHAIDSLLTETVSALPTGIPIPERPLRPIKKRRPTFTANLAQMPCISTTAPTSSPSSTTTLSASEAPNDAGGSPQDFPSNMSLISLLVRGNIHRASKMKGITTSGIADYERSRQSPSTDLMLSEWSANAGEGQTRYDHNASTSVSLVGSGGAFYQSLHDVLESTLQELDCISDCIALETTSTQLRQRKGTSPQFDAMLFARQ